MYLFSSMCIWGRRLNDIEIIWILILPLHTVTQWGLVWTLHQTHSAHLAPVQRIPITSNLSSSNPASCLLRVRVHSPWNRKELNTVKYSCWKKKENTTAERLWTHLQAQIGSLICYSKRGPRSPGSQYQQVQTRVAKRRQRRKKTKKKGKEESVELHYMSRSKTWRQGLDSTWPSPSFPTTVWCLFLHREAQKVTQQSLGFWWEPLCRAVLSVSV